VLKKLLADLGDLQKEVDKVLNEACDSQEEVGKLRNKLDDCMIPVTIQFRKA
jgi:regulator of replication initiation timing